MFGYLFHSFILAQILGLYMVIMSIIMLSRASLYRGLIAQVQLGSSGLIIASSFSLFIGIGLVTIHNLWVWEPRLMVTLVAWFILVKSVLWLSFPECMLRCTKRLYAGPGYYVVSIIVAIIGIFLLTKGFYHWMWIPGVVTHEMVVPG